MAHRPTRDATETTTQRRDCPACGVSGEDDLAEVGAATLRCPAAECRVTRFALRPSPDG